MKQVTRYDPGCDYAGQDEMIEAADGDFVRWSDFETMQARAEAAEASAEVWRAESINAHGELTLAMAELVELRKQEPVAWCPKSQVEALKKHSMVDADLAAMQRFDEMPLFARPAPAVNVSELQAQALDAAASKAGIYCRAHKTGSPSWHKWKTAVMFLVGEASALRSNDDE